MRQDKFSKAHLTLYACGIIPVVWLNCLMGSPTHPFLRSEFSMIEGEEEFVPYPSRQKTPRKKSGMER